MELTLSELKSLMDKTSNSHSFKLGECYLIRSVTLYYVGRLVSITDSDLVLDDASWVADTGRFASSLKTGDLKEVEPFWGSVIIARGSIVDACVWKHKLPSDQK